MTSWSSIPSRSTARAASGSRHYEIITAPDAGLDAPRRDFLTRSEDLFDQAVELEGRQQRVNLTWHRSKRPNGVGCDVLDAFQERTL